MEKASILCTDYCKHRKPCGLSIPEKRRAQAFASSINLLTHSRQCPYL